MVEKISVQIALEGGAEVERQLAGIGKAGQQAFAEIEKSASEVGGFKNLKPEEVTTKLKAMGVEGTAAFDKIQQAVAKAANLERLVVGVQSVENAFVALGRAAGPVGLAIAAGLAAATKATLAFAETVQKASADATKLGLSLQGLKSLQETMLRLGVSAQAAAEGFGKFQQQQQKAAQADPGSNLALFGQNADVAKQQLERFLQQLRQMPDGLQRTNLAISQLGETAGTQFIQGLRLAEGSMSGTEAKAETLRQASERLATAWTNFGSLTFSPAIVQGLNLASAALMNLDRLLTSMNWSAAGTAATTALSPLPNLLQLLGGTIVQLGSQLLGFGQAGAQGGQQAAQGLQLVTNPLTGMPELIRTTNAALQQTGQAGQQAGQQAAQGAQQATSAWQTFLGVLQQAWELLKKGLGIGAPGAPKAAGGGQFARGGRVWGAGSSTSDSIPAWLSRGEFVIQAAAVRRYGAGLFAALNAGRFAGGGAVGGGSTDIFSEALLRKLGQMSQEQIEALNVMDEDISAIGQEVVALQSYIGASNDDCKKHSAATSAKLDKLIETTDIFAEALIRKLGSIGDNAAGGLLGGRGTGTSDSNLAWLSRGEHIMPARAVAQPGVLAFLEALRRSGGNLRGVLDGMGRFALGGLVPQVMPVFAGGGLAGGNHVTIAFPGLPPISGLRASSAVVEELRKSAALAQVRSGGRKPSRYS